MRIAIAVTLLASLILPAAVPAAQQGASWALIGPIGPGPVTIVAPASDWPDDQTIVVAKRGELFRTYDGGATWEPLPALAEAPTALIFDSFTGGRVAFAITGRDNQPKSILRSADDAASWQSVVTGMGGQPKLVLSPGFAQDGMALLVSDGRLYRSTDAGLTWTELSPVSNQLVQQAVISPDYPVDRTVYIAVTSGGFPAFLGDRPADQPSTDHEQSVGILVSTDGGESWATMSNGLEIDGTPYHHVQHLAISPTFARDGTLFAYAWGPRLPTTIGQAKVRNGDSALFRSRDRGAVWSKVDGFAGGGRLALALSPTYADDLIAVRARNISGFTPASSTCTVSRTANGGDSWAEVIRPVSYEVCGEPSLFGTGASLSGLVLKGGTWLWSTDGGATWSALRPPLGSITQARPAVAVSPSFDRDRIVFAGSSFGGVWAYGPEVRQTLGHTPCQSESVGGFERALATEIKARAWLGCALDTERPVTVRERRVGSKRAFWPENDTPNWFEVSDGPPDRWNSWRSFAKAQQPLPEGTEISIDGAIQRFEGGTLLFLPRPDGQRTILVLAGPSSGEWRELPD